MNIALYFIRRAELAHKRRELRRINEHLFVLRDQVASGLAGIARYEAKAQRIEEEMALLESPDDIVRRAGAGA